MKLCNEPVGAKSVYSTIDRAFKHVITLVKWGWRGPVIILHGEIEITKDKLTVCCNSENLCDELVVAGVGSRREVGGVNSVSDLLSFLVGMWIRKAYSRLQGDQSTSMLLLHV